MTPDDVVVSRAPGHDVVTVTGDLDVDSAPPVWTTVVHALTERAEWRASQDVTTSDVFVLDLSAVAFVASAGLTLLVDLDEEASAKDLQLIVVTTPSSTLSRRLGRTGLDHVLALKPLPG